MKTPRLAFLALWALLASSFAAAVEPGWTPKVQAGTAWTAITFKTEKGVAKRYWFRSDAKGDKIPLYTLKGEKNDSVKGSNYYKSEVSAYTMTIVPSPRAYAVVQPGTSYTFAGTPNGSLSPGNVVVAAPTGAPEKLDPTPISVFTPGLAPVKWEDYYFTRPASETSWWHLTDPDKAYRASMENFKEMHLRVFPFEYLFDSDKCFVRPEACSDGKNPKYTRFIEAGAEAARGNLLLIEPIAVESHKYYADEARKFKTELDGAPADKFTEPENKFLQRLLIDNGMFDRFQTELRGVKPEKQPLFVKKWRGYLKNEIDAYLAVSEKAGDKPVDQSGSRAAMLARIKAAADLPLGAVAVTPDKPVKPVKPENRPLAKKDEAKLWNGTITAVGDWHAIQTSKLPLPLNLAIPLPSLTFYCYHQKMGTDKNLTDHLKKWPLIVECVNWSAPKEDATQDEAGKKFKIRNNIVKFDLAYVNGKLTTLNTGVTVVVTELKALPDALGGEKFVKVTSPQAPAVAGALPLSAKELTWLDKLQAGEYATDKAAAEAKPADQKAAAIKALGEKYRKNVFDNLQPKPEAAAYEAAAKAADATQEKIDKELPAEVWGGKNAAIVELFGANEDLQLTEADYKELNTKFPDDAAKYRELRALISGRRSPKETAFDPKFYDPIVLHRTAEAARKVLGKVPGAKPPVVAPARTVLTDDEIKLLTPEEAKKYKEYVISATKKDKDGKDYVDTTDEKLLAYAEMLRKKMNEEKPPRSQAKAPPSSEEMTLAQFDALPLFQKRQFCKDYGPDIALVEKDARAGDIDNATANALKGARNTAANPVTKPNKSSPPADTKWPKKDRQDACRKLPPEIAGEINPTPSKTPDNGIGNLINGADTEGKPAIKKPDLLSIPLAQTAFVGGLTGLLIGSLFGPVGLIAGPLLGAALYYGLAVHKDYKTKNPDPKEEE